MSCVVFWREIASYLRVMTGVIKAHLALVLSFSYLMDEEAQTTRGEVEFRARHHDKAVRPS